MQKYFYNAYRSYYLFGQLKIIGIETVLMFLAYIYASVGEVISVDFEWCQLIHGRST